MIPGADLLTVAPVGRVTPAAGAPAAGDARQQEFERALAGQLGKSMRAEVLTRLTDGSFLVRVAGTQARMMLPSNPQPGAEVQLTLVALNPRPTFQLGTAPGSAPFAAFVDSQPHPAVPASPSASALYAPGARANGAATPMQRAASLFADAPAAYQLSDVDPASGHATLSAAARAISSVLALASSAAHPQTAIIAPLPLLDGRPTDPARLGAALKGAIDASGLFYESHVAEWSAGKRPLADLLREPQMQRAPASGAARPDAESAPAAFAAPAGPGSAPYPSDPAIAQFINLQLASQEQGRIQWQGQLWAGQPMSWEISRDPPERGGQPPGGDEPPEPPWRSALRLRFPQLGEIRASVVLAGDQLHIELQAGSGEVGGLLRARAGELQHALEASGNTLASLTVDSGHGNE
jgi:hypothetical protein